MRIRKWYVSAFLMSVSLLSLTSCAIRRETDSLWSSEGNGDSEVNTAKIYRVDQSGSVNAEDVLQIFLGMSFDETAEHRYSNGWEIDGKSLFVGLDNRGMPVDSVDQQIDTVSYRDKNYGLMDCYEAVIMAPVSEWVAEGTLRNNLPMEELEVYSREEVIEKCQPYADILGYSDAFVSTYAITLDVLEEYVRHWDNRREDGYQYISAPGPGFEVVTLRQLDEAKAAGDEETYNELREYIVEGAITRGIPWEKKHEIIFVTYHPRIDGYIMGGNSDDFLEIWYSPLYETPIYITGYVAPAMAEVLEERELISKKDAIGAIVMMKGLSSEDEIEVKDISLVYALQCVIEEGASPLLAMLQGEDGGAVETAIPCWNVEYIHKGITCNELIDAVYGDAYVRYSYLE